ncbi:hypothetical protein Q8F55_009219 [Vanrija albida]|uniref:F-box domain-containing protein n=1 Tax=Vanrija albida TaxID=181172 RepID=A0ABR3PT13_9TREE
MRTASRGVYARCNAALYSHVEMRLRYVKPSAEIIKQCWDVRPPTHRLELFIPSSGVRVPDTERYGTTGRRVSLSPLCDFVRVLDANFEDAPGPNRWWQFLYDNPEVGKMVHAAVVRRLEETILVDEGIVIDEIMASVWDANGPPSSVRTPSWQFGGPNPRLKPLTEIYLANLGVPPSPGSVGVTIMEGGTELSVLVVQFGPRQNNLRLLDYIFCLRASTPPVVTPPRDVLDHSAFPHLFDLILSYLPKPALLYMRAASRDLQERCELALYHHVWIRLRRVAPAGHRIEFLVPDSDGLRLPRMKWYEDDGWGKCMHLLWYFLCIVDIDFNDDAGRADWEAFLETAPGLSGALRNRPVLRRVEGRPVANGATPCVPLSLPHAMEQGPPDPTTPIEMCLVNLGADRCQGCVGVTLQRGIETAVLIVAPTLVVMFDPIAVSGEAAVAALEILGGFFRRSLVMPLDPFAQAPPAIIVGLLEVFSDRKTDRRLSIAERRKAVLETLLDPVAGERPTRDDPCRKTITLLTRRGLNKRFGDIDWACLSMPWWDYEFE